MSAWRASSSSIKHSKACHFTDDTNILQSDQSLTELAKRTMNTNLRRLSQWLKANNLLSNVKKTEPVIFHSNTKKVDESIEFKLDWKRLLPSDSIKNLGILLDKHLQWSTQLNHVTMKLNQAIGMLSKLRYKSSSKQLKMTYHSLCGSDLLYGSQLWGQTNIET